MVLLLPETKEHLTAKSLHYHHNTVMFMIILKVFLHG